MTRDRLLVSLSPDKLPLASRFDAGIEVKFDWEHEALLTGRRSLESVVTEAGIDTERIRSIHLPPGTRQRFGMTVTEGNRETIVDFVHEQVSGIPEAFPTAHPPKRFSYVDQLRLFESLLELTERPLAIENLPDDCRWHSPASLAFFAHAGREYRTLSGLWLTVDSAHLPDDPRSTAQLQSLPDDWGSDVADALSDDDRSLPTGFVDDHERRLEDQIDEYFSGTDPDGSVESRWVPFAQAVFTTADRIKSVHLNDPADDGLPSLGGRDEDPVLRAAIDCALDRGVYLVLEPSTIDGSQLVERVDDVANAL